MEFRPLLHCLAASALAWSSTCAAADTIVQLRVLETTDLHVHISDYDYYQDRSSNAIGLVRTAALIAAARAEVPNSVLVDNGDLLQGNPLGDFIARQRGLGEGEIHPVYKAMNLLDYTVGNVGNHEFNFGLTFLERSLAGANFPYISANVFHDDGDDDPNNDRPYFDQYLIVERRLRAEDGSEHGIRLGFIGFVPPQIMNWDMAHLKGRVVAHDIVDTARRLVPRMKAEGADVVIAIPHSGIATAQRRGMDENAAYYLTRVEGIDAVLFGHTHGVFPGEEYADIEGVDIDRGTINGIPATMPGGWGSHLGYVDLTLSVTNTGTWKIVDGVGGVRPIARHEGQDVIPLVEPVEEIVAAVKDDHEAAIAFVRTAVGEISAPINSFFALVRDDPSVQIVSNAQKRYIERLIRGTEYDGMPVLSASAPFKSGGRGGNLYFTDIEAGEIALKHVADLYIYPNTVRAVAVRGSEVREWLEMSASVFNRIDPANTGEQELLNPGYLSFNFDVIDGVEYRIDITRPARYDADGGLLDAASHRITGLRFEGEPIDPEQLFVVATNSYRASGGGNFPGLDGSNIIIEAPDSNRDVLAAYLLDLGTVDPSADMNWSFAPIPGDVYVTFKSSPRADKALRPEWGIERIGTNSDGFGLYRIHFDR